MAEQLWHDDDSENELDPIHSLVAGLADPDDIDAYYYRGIPGRRRKAAIALTVVWGGTVALHLVSWGIWFVLALTTMVGLHAMRVIFSRPRRLPEPLSLEDPAQVPFVSLLVAAKNEEAVIAPLVKTLCSLNYPVHRYELWVIDDNSSDRTPLILDRLTQEYTQLQVVHRSADATGGKSGALNAVLPLTKGDIIGVFDADAQVTADLLRRVLPLFNRGQVGAVQVRKAIAQAELPGQPNARNFWIQGQRAEMALDTFFQQQRIAVGGIGELRGNGQFVRRTALKRCGGWNEETITDDLDLTIRLHLDQWDIECLVAPPVIEEGVTNVRGLWHQRNRWAEGGYQRYLDYWRLILRNRMGTRKTLDLAVFLMTQYVMPTAAVPDLVMAIARNTTPMLAPVTSITIAFSLVGMMMGLHRIRVGGRPSLEKARSMSLPTLLTTLFQAIQGTVYMLHWLPVIASTAVRISIRPKRLKWVKTVHHGTDEMWLDLPEQS